MELSVDKKLGDLLLSGWTMLGESCSVETCRCPLMKKQNSQKYCCGCEVWVLEGNKWEKLSFSDLLAGKRASKKPQNVQPQNINNQEVKNQTKDKKENLDEKKENLLEKKDDFNRTKLLKVLNSKMDFLTEKLEQATDISIIEQTTKALILNMEALSKFTEMSK